MDENNLWFFTYHSFQAAPTKQIEFIKAYSLRNKILYAASIEIFIPNSCTEDSLIFIVNLFCNFSSRSRKKIPVSNYKEYG